MLIGRIRIVHDEYGENPRDNSDYGSVLLAFHGRYNLGDKDAPGFNPRDYAGWSEMRATIEKRANPAVILPVYLYDHGGLSVSTEPFACAWDSGQLGWIYIPRSNLDTHYGIKRLTVKGRERLEKSLRAEIDELNTYLTEGCYGFIAEERTQDGWNEVDTCWGFVGRDHTKNGMVDHFYGWTAKGYEIQEAT